MASPSATYKYDIAISLCNSDLEFARKLVKAINPSLKIFFYDDKQRELISKSGPEACAKIFKEESRIIVILSRDEWSKSYYTEIERNAILDRTSVNGYQFLMVMPMKEGELPPWYPFTQIYANPSRFSIEELAHFIEFKVADEGGLVKALNLEDRYQNLIDRIELKKSIVKLQQDKFAIEAATDEILEFKDCFNKKAEFLRKDQADKTFWEPFSVYFDKSKLGFGNHLLECQFILFKGMYPNIFVTTQDICVQFELYKMLGQGNRELVEEEQRFFYFTSELQGWALPYMPEEPTKSELQVLFQHRFSPQYYDLKDIIPTSSLIDSWFQRLLVKSTEVIERYI